MDLLQIAAIAGSGPGDAITDMLGVLAVCSFLGIAGYIAMQALKTDSKPKAHITADLVPVQAESTPKTEEPKRKEDTVEEEKAKLEKHCEAMMFEIIERGRARLEDVAGMAQETFNQVAEGYASNSFGHEGETHPVRAKKFQQICERQWGGLRSDIGYVNHMDILEHLRHILENHRLLDGRSNQNTEVTDLSPDLLRSQELVALMRVVPRDKARFVQEQMLKAIEGYRNYFGEEHKSWLNEQITKLSVELRPRKSKRVQITDTEYYKKFKQLKVRLEVVARLSEGVTDNTQQVREVGLALSQVLHVGALLRIIACLPEWFSELGLSDVEATASTASS